MPATEQKMIIIQNTEMWILFLNIVKKYKLLEEKIITEEDLKLFKSWNMLTPPTKKVLDILMAVKMAKSIYR